MAGLSQDKEANRVSDQEAGPNCKLEPATGSAGASPLTPHLLFKKLVFVRYLDHVLYNRTSAVVMKPQIREAVGWLIYDCELYIILAWDKDAEPPTLRGGDPKASGLVLLKNEILEIKYLG